VKSDFVIRIIESKMLSTPKVRLKDGLVKKQTLALQGFVGWWNWRELNPRPKVF